MSFGDDNAVIVLLYTRKRMSSQFAPWLYCTFVFNELCNTVYTYNVYGFHLSTW
jgi:hypothetical protein